MDRSIKDRKGVGTLFVADYADKKTEAKFAEGTVYLMPEEKVIGRYDYAGRVYNSSNECIGYVKGNTLVMSIRYELKLVEEITKPCKFDGKVELERTLGKMCGRKRGKICEVGGKGEALGKYVLNGASVSGAGAAYMLLLHKNRISKSNHKGFYRDALYTLITHMEGDVEKSRKDYYEKKMKDIDEWIDLVFSWETED